MVAVEGEGFLHGLVDDDGQAGFIGVAELFVERADDRLRALDQVIVFQDQVSGRWMRVEIFERVTVPMFGHVHDLVNVKVSFPRIGELTSCIIDPRNGGGEHVERVAGKVDDARFGKKFDERFDLCAERGILGDEIFFTRGIHVPLDHRAVKGHDAFFVFRAEGFVEVLVIRKFIHERKEERDEVAVPDVQVDVLILFGLEKGNGMNLDLAKRGGIEFVEQFVQGSVEIFVVEPCDKLRDLLLRDRGREVNIPGGEAGEGFRIAREQAVQKGGAAPQIAEDEKRFFDGTVFVIGEENVVERETQPVHQTAERPDEVEKDEEDNSFGGEAGGGVF